MPKKETQSLIRCHWVSDDPQYRAYHDEEFASLLTTIDEGYEEKEVFRKMSEMLAEGV